MGSVDRKLRKGVQEEAFGLRGEGNSALAI